MSGDVDQRNVNLDPYVMFDLLDPTLSNGHFEAPHP